MSEKTPSKAEALRAMREANYAAKSSAPPNLSSLPQAGESGPSVTTPVGGAEANPAGKRPKSSALTGVAAGGNVTRGSEVRILGGAPSSDDGVEGHADDLTRIPYGSYASGDNGRAAGIKPGPSDANSGAVARRGNDVSPATQSGQPAQPEAKSAPDHCAPHNSGERLSKGDPTDSGAGTKPKFDRNEAHRKYMREYMRKRRAKK